MCDCGKVWCPECGMDPKVTSKQEESCYPDYEVSEIARALLRGAHINCEDKRIESVDVIGTVVSIMVDGETHIIRGVRVVAGKP